MFGSGMLDCLKEELSIAYWRQYQLSYSVYSCIINVGQIIIGHPDKMAYVVGDLRWHEGRFP